MSELDGLLDVGDGNSIYWSVAGALDGNVVVALHGGPGQGSWPNMRRGFDLERWRVVLFDQRGCGRSRPHASDPTTDMRVNTTPHLVADMEKLREHLGIARWLVMGASWGVTLALAYAQKHPTRVSALVLQDVTTSRRSETDWLYRGLSRFFPAAWARFRDHVNDDDLYAAYARRLEDADASVRIAAARAWCAWENAILGLEPNPPCASETTDEALIALARICAHYAANGAFVEDDLVHGASKLTMPGVIIHGTRDMPCPIETAWQLARAWPGAELVEIADAGHLRSDAKRAAFERAFDRFAHDRVE